MVKMGHPHCACRIHDKRNTSRQWTTFIVMTVKIATCRFNLPLLHPSIFFTSFHISQCFKYLISQVNCSPLQFLCSPHKLRTILQPKYNKNKDFLSKFLTFLKLFHLIIDNFSTLFINCKNVFYVSHSYIPHLRPRSCPLTFYKYM
jgi:hypothetical protein